MKTTAQIHVYNKKMLLVIYGLLAILLILISIGYYHFEKSRIRTEKYNDLQAIAEMKIGQIHQWQNERTNGVKINSQSPLLTKSVLQWLDHPKDSIARKNTINLLSLSKKKFNLENIHILSTSGDALLSTASRPIKIDSILKTNTNRAVVKNEISYTGFYNCSSQNMMHYDLIAPIADNQNHIAAVLVYCVNLGDFLNALIKTWPSNIKSTELLLTFKQDSEVFFITNSSNPIIKNSCTPVSQVDNVTAKAITGYSGIFEGKDYRGKNVLADIQPVSGTTLYMITKIDESEIFSPLNYKIGVVTIFIFFLLSFLGFGMAFIYSNRQKNIYRELFLKEKALREALGKFSTTLYSIGDAVICSDTYGRIKQMNRVSEMLTGWKETEALNQSLEHVFRIIDESSRAPFNGLIEKVIANDSSGVLKADSLLISREGEEIPISKSVAAIIDESGIFSGIVLVFRDQTEERLAQKALKESEEQYRLLFEKSAEAIFLVDQITGQYIDANFAAEKLTGRSRRELIENKTSDITPFGSKERLVQLSSTEKSQEFGEVEYIRPDGTKRIALLSTVLLANNTVYGIARDITGRKHAENELFKAKEKAEESDRLKTAFLNNISHEIRTPMNAIFGFSKLLSSSDFSKEKVKYFTDIICQSSIQLESIITDIICIATLEAGQEKVRSKEFNLNALLQSIYAQFEIKIAPKKLSFKLSPSLNEAEYIVSDITKLTQILSNLLNNALKFTSQGHIHFGYTLRDKFLEFFVEDTGIGISPVNHKIIFDRFRQADNTISPTYGGTGLGLSISKSYVELLGGRIWLESELTKGSTFYFTIPYKASMLHSQETKKMVSESILHFNTPKIILIAEDENLNFMLLNEMLKKHAFVIIRANDGLEAVNYCKANHVDLILMDIKMPVMDGFEATKQIKSFKSSLPIIAQTAYAHPSDKVKVKKCGCNDYISKPISEEELIKLLNKHLQTA